MRLARREWLQRGQPGRHEEYFSASLYSSVFTVGRASSLNEQFLDVVTGMVDKEVKLKLYECNQPLVPLHKEIKMLRDYIVLEQIRYNDQLDVTIDLPENDLDLMIAPLLLLAAGMVGR